MASTTSLASATSTPSTSAGTTPVFNTVLGGAPPATSAAWKQLCQQPGLTVQIRKNMPQELFNSVTKNVTKLEKGAKGPLNKAYLPSNIASTLLKEYERKLHIVHEELEKELQDVEKLASTRWNHLFPDEKGPEGVANEAKREQLQTTVDDGKNTKRALLSTFDALMDELVTLSKMASEKKLLKRYLEFLETIEEDDYRSAGSFILV